MRLRGMRALKDEGYFDFKNKKTDWTKRLKEIDQKMFEKCLKKSKKRIKKRKRNTNKNDIVRNL